MKVDLITALASATHLIELESKLIHELNRVKLASGKRGLGFVCGPMHPEESGVDVQVMFNRLREYAEVASEVAGSPVFSLADIMTPEAYVCIRQDERYWKRLAEMLENVFFEASVTDVYMVPGWNSCPCANRLKRVAAKTLMRVTLVSPFASVLAIRVGAGQSAEAYWVNPQYRRQFAEYAAS